MSKIKIMIKVVSISLVVNLFSYTNASASVLSNFFQRNSSECIQDLNETKVLDIHFNNNGINLGPDVNNISYSILKNDTRNYYLHIKPIDNNGNIGNTLHCLIDSPKLSLTENSIEQKIRLDWTVSNPNEKLFKIYKRKYGEINFQNIGIKNLQNTNRTDDLDTYSGSNIYSVFTAINRDTVSILSSVNQLSNGNSIIDNNAYDNAAPNIPTLDSFGIKDENMVFFINTPSDNGTKYEYYVESISRDSGNTTLSNISSGDVVSGLKGFVYVVDDSSKTKPTLKNTFTKEAKITVATTTKNKYLHVSSIDNAGNISDAIHINLNDYVPDTPLINVISPKNDRLFLEKESIYINWTFNDAMYPIPKKTIITVKDKISNVSKEHIIGSNTGYSLRLSPGEYEISIQSFNASNIGSNIEKIFVRVNSFKESGNVQTIDITPNSNISRIMVITECEIPQGTSLKGKIYYSKDSNGNIDYTKYINFNIDDNIYSADVLNLPESTDKLRIEYVLSRENSKNISPYLEGIQVYAR